MRYYRTALRLGPALFGLVLAGRLHSRAELSSPSTMASLKTPAQLVGAPPGAFAEAGLADWWTSFNDPVLSWLVDHALAANLDIDVAGARLRQARAVARGARGALLPTWAWAAVRPPRGSSVQAPRAAARPASRRDSMLPGRSISLAVSAARSRPPGRPGIDGSRATRCPAQRRRRGRAQLYRGEHCTGAVGCRPLKSRLAGRNRSDRRLAGAGRTGQFDSTSNRPRRCAPRPRRRSRRSKPSFAAAVNRLAVLIGEAPGGSPPGSIRYARFPSRPMRSTSASRRPLCSAGRTSPPPSVRWRPRPRGSGSRTARALSGAQPYRFLHTARRARSQHAFATGSAACVAAVTAPIFEGGQIRARIEAQRGRAPMPRWRTIVRRC